MLEEALGRLAAAADDSLGYAERWKQEHGRHVIGTFPMNFPVEIIHAAGALPVIVQEDRAQITAGRNLLFEFYCGYTRSIADQAATQKLGMIDAFFLVDHCVALLGAVDAMRYELPDQPMFLAQYIASMDEPWTPPEIRAKVRALREQLEEFTGTAISDEALARSIRAFNHNRQLLREVYALRRTGRTAITARQMQILVKSSMVMDIEEHSAILGELIEHLVAESETNPELV